MRRAIIFAAPVLAVVLAVPAAMASAVPSAAHAAPAMSALGPPTPGSVEDRNLSRWLDQVEQNPNEFVQNLEEACIQSGGPACDMDASDIAKIPGDLKADAEGFRAELDGDPALAAEIRQDVAEAEQADAAQAPAEAGGMQARALGAGVSKMVKMVGSLASGSKNAAIRAVGKLKADQIGDIADNVSRAVYTHNGFVESTPAAIAKIAIYSTPIIGDVFSLGEAIFGADMTVGERVENGVVAAVSLAGAAAALACPPLGAVIGVGVAGYYVGKALWGWLTGGEEEEEWIIDPPLTPQDLYDRGADIQWETHLSAGRQAAVDVWNAPPSSEPGWAQTNWDPISPGTATVIVHPENGWLPSPYDMSGHTVTQTLLLDSKWPSPERHEKGLVPYALEPLVFSGGHVNSFAVELGNEWGAQAAEFAVWQDGKKSVGQCRVEKHHHPVGMPQVIEVFCGLDPYQPRVMVSEGHPAVLEIATTYNLADAKPEYQCTPDPACIPPGAQTPPLGNLLLYANSGMRYQTVALRVDYSYAIVAPPVIKAN